MLSRARRRRLAAQSAICVAGLALVGAPAATAAEVGAGPLPAALPTPPAGGAAPGGAAAAAVTTHSGRCGGAGPRPGHASDARMRRALLCLVNRERRRHGR